MKAAIHPDNYQTVVFEDLNNGTKFLTKSTAKSDDTITWEDGNTYPLIKVHITSASHPFFTGQEKLLDVEGRVDKFKARAEAAEKARAAKQKQGSAAKPAKKKAKESTKIEGLKQTRSSK